MKRAGIITFHCADNFGAVLQAYALQQIIKEMHIDVEIINFKPKELLIPYNHTFDFIEKVKKKGIKLAIRQFLSKIYNYSNIERRMKSFNHFRFNHLKVSGNTYYSSNDLLNAPPKYDYYISGSDQVWNPSFKKAIGDSYFLDFAGDDSIKMSYAASIAEEVEDKLIKEYKEYIERFDFISVREKSGLEFLQRILNKNVVMSLDPTLLLNNNEWKYISKKPEINERYILVYSLQHNYELIKLTNKLSEKMNLKVISFENKKYFNNAIESFYYKGPEEFLGLFENAELILTNSFHGTVFSVINNKPFYTIPHTTSGSRMIDLLKILNLENRIFYKSEDVKKVDYDINYNKVNSILEEKRKESINFLKKSLNIRDNCDEN